MIRTGISSRWASGSALDLGRVADGNLHVSMAGRLPFARRVQYASDLAHLPLRIRNGVTDDASVHSFPGHGLVTILVGAVGTRIPYLVSVLRADMAEGASVVMRIGRAGHEKGAPFPSPATRCRKQPAPGREPGTDALGGPTLLGGSLPPQRRFLD